MNIQHQSSICEPTPQPQIDKPALKKLIISSLVCSVFMIAEAVGGILANSLAVGTDAAHLLVDLISFLISISSVCLAARRPSARLNFGWYRAEAIGALFSVMFIWVVTVILVGLAILRIMHGEFEIDCEVMLITSSAGLVLNIIMMIILQGGGHHHHHFVSADHQRAANDNDDEVTEVPVSRRETLSHSINRPSETVDNLEDSPSDRAETAALLNGTSSSYGSSAERDKGRVGQGVVRSHSGNINVRAAFIHVLGDLVQSLGVVVAALIIYFKPEYKIADPICTFFFSFLVLCTTLHILKDTIHILMEGFPKHLNREEIKGHLLRLPRVKSVHDLRVWVLKYDKMVASVHLVLERKSEDGSDSWPSNDEILIAARRTFKELFAIGDCTVQLEERFKFSPEESLAQGQALAEQ